MSRISEACGHSNWSILHGAVLDHGGVVQHRQTGAMAFDWQGASRAFMLVRSGRLSVQYLTRSKAQSWAECRASGGLDCLPVTAAILSGHKINVRATCLQPTSWIELEAEVFTELVAQDTGFRQALFSLHAARLPVLFRRVSGEGVNSNDQRLAAWLIAHAVNGQVTATHGVIAADLLTAREVVSRRLKGFAVKGWISQQRGRTVIEAAGALSRVARGSPSWRCVDKTQRRKAR